LLSIAVFGHALPKARGRCKQRGLKSLAYLANFAKVDDKFSVFMGGSI